MAVPTDEQIKAYADKLPDIYKAVLGAFPGLESRRRYGDALTAESVAGHVSRLGHRPGDAYDALEKLVGQGFLANDDNVAYSPTPLGERLITALTGHTPGAAGIPELPVPTWG